MQQKTVKRFAAAALTLALCAAFSACGQKQGTLASFEWAIEPQYEFEKVEPVLDSAAMLEGTVCAAPGEAGYYLAQTARGWGVLDTATGRLAAEGAFPQQPYRCGMGHLHGQDTGNAYEREQKYNAQLAALGSTFEIGGGHCETICSYRLEPESGEVFFVQSNGVGGGADICPVAKAQNGFDGLLAVTQGEWHDDEMNGGSFLGKKPGSLYAVASKTGELLTGFVYDAAGMAGPELIAVQKDGRWGYVNGEGKEVVPCGYEGFWGAAGAWDGAAETYVYGPANYPAPCTEGCVVVKKDGETGVLRADGSVLLAFGEVEDAAPAQGGLLWVKTGGRWGALRLPAGAAD